MNSYKLIKHRVELRNWWYWIPCCLTIPLFVVFYSKVHHDVNPDLIAYFSVAKHYQNLDFVQAFNSYWSPLICWILAFAPNLVDSPLLAFRIVNIGIALLLFYQLFFWIRLVVYKSFSRFLLCFLSMLLIVELSLSIGTPDFLSLYCFFLFLKVLLQYRFEWKKSLLLGFLVLICYFSKTFLLSLSIGVLILYMLFLFFSLKKKIVIKQLLLVLLVVCTGLFIWASCLKMHYGFYTLSSSAGFNNSISSSEIVSLQAPKFENSLFVWEDPYYINVTSLFSESLDSIVNILQKRFMYNIGITLYYFKFISYLGLLLLLFPFIGFFQKKTRQWKICFLLFKIGRAHV